MTFDQLGDHINFLKTVKRVDFWTLDMTVGLLG